MKYDSVEQIEKTVAQLIKKETTATVEVTIRDDVMIYTEDLDKVEAVKSFVTKTGYIFKRESFYEADEYCPAGITLTYESKP